MIHGTLRIPGSKSHTHRAYVLAARSDAPCTVANPLRAADPDATLAALQQLGARIHLGEHEVTFQPATLRPSIAPIDLRNAGTGLRLILAQIATLPFETTLLGDESLSARPNDELIDALVHLGARIESSGGRLPIRARGPITSGSVALSGAISSQFTSALMMALPMLTGDSHIALTPPIRSRPYLDITQTILAAFGMPLHEEGDVYHMKGGQVPRCPVYDVPGDWSTAAFPMAAAAMTDGDVHLTGLDPEDPQGDKAIVGLLRSFGARVDVGDDVHVRGGKLVSPGTIDVAATPDLFPILAIVAAHSEGTTEFVGGASLRHKETDRIKAVADGLHAMGIRVEESDEGLIVHGGRLQGADVAAHDDHRIHMAFSIAALVADGKTNVSDPDSVRISYPRFHEDMQSLGAPA